MDSQRRGVSVEGLGAPVPVAFAPVSGPADVSALAHWEPERFPGPDLVAVLSADLGDELGAVLEALRPRLHEIVCCDGDDRTVPPALGYDLATVALESLGVGQDFVYTVPGAEDAVDHAVRSIAGEDSGWSGRAVLVVGGTATIQRVRDHLDRSVPGRDTDT
jgi:hypothetical protein